jgi:IMP dehydrogenase
MKTEIEVCTPDDSAAKAAEIMSRCNCGFVPIVESLGNWMLKGVLTDRDLALYLGKANRPAGDVRLREFFSRNPRTVSPDTEIHEVEKLLEEARIHRVPVVDSGGKLVGIISLKDLAEEAWRERGKKEGAEVRESELAEILEAIALSR